jgi:hypothetical protein
MHQAYRAMAESGSLRHGRAVREMMLSMTLALAWVAATGGVLATIGTWAGPLRSGWNLRAETIRNGQDRRENELHRQRFSEIWQQFQDDPDRAAAYNRYADWTSAPGGGPLPAGGHSGNVDDAYSHYLTDLEARYYPGRPGTPRWHLRAIGRRRQHPSGEIGTGGAASPGATQEG